LLLLQTIWPVDIEIYIIKEYEYNLTKRYYHRTNCTYEWEINEDKKGFILKTLEN